MKNSQKHNVQLINLMNRIFHSSSTQEDRTHRVSKRKTMIIILFIIC